MIRSSNYPVKNRLQKLLWFQCAVSLEYANRHTGVLHPCVDLIQPLTITRFENLVLMAYDRRGGFFLFRYLNPAYLSDDTFICQMLRMEGKSHTRNPTSSVLRHFMNQAASYCSSVSYTPNFPGMA